MITALPSPLLNRGRKRRQMLLLAMKGDGAGAVVKGRDQVKLLMESGGGRIDPGK